MRVLLANKFFFPNGGSERVMFDERDFLIRSGIDVVDFSMHHNRNLPSPYHRYFIDNREYRSGGAVNALDRAVSLIHSREAVKKIGSLIDETRPQVLHCHNIYHQMTPSIIGAAKSRGIPVVLTLHDSKPVCPIYTGVRAGQLCALCGKGDFSHVVRNRCADGSLARSLTLYAEAVVQRWLGNYEKVDRFVAPSRFMRNAVLARFPPDKVVLLYNGVDTQNIRPTGRDDGYVLYCGRLAPGKGVETLLNAHRALGSPWPLVIAGSGPLADQLSSQFGGNVRFTGHLSGDALSATFANAALVVIPSEWSENCSMTILEAMAYGKATIGSRIGGIPELIVDGKTGLMFEAKNTGQLARCLAQLMDDPSRRAAMGEHGRNRVEMLFSLDRHNAALLALYSSLSSTPANTMH